VSKEDVLQEIERTSRCQQCKDCPTMWLWYDGLIISGCDEHVTQIAEVSSATDYYNQRYVHYVVTEHLEGNC